VSKDPKRPDTPLVLQVPEKMPASAFAEGHDGGRGDCKLFEGKTFIGCEKKVGP